MYKKLGVQNCTMKMNGLLLLIGIMVCLLNILFSSTTEAQIVEEIVYECEVDSECPTGKVCIEWRSRHKMACFNPDDGKRLEVAPDFDERRSD